MSKSQIPNQRETTILESINEGVFTADLDWHITAFNRAAERITGVPATQAIGSACCDVFHASICETSCVLRRIFDLPPFYVPTSVRVWAVFSSVCSGG